MDNKRKNIFSRKRAFAFVGIFILICAVGIGFWVKKPQMEDRILGNNNSLPVVIDTSQPPPSLGDSSKQDEKYHLAIVLGDGKPQPQTVEVSPLATGEPLSP